jgi:glycosyltransferase involved in cell wall biosynthesis
MRIGIDACTWGNRRGYGRFTRTLVTTMLVDHPQHKYTLVVDQHTAATRDHFPNGADIEIVQTREQPIKAASAYGSRSIADLWRLSGTASRSQFDVFLFPTSYSFYPMFGNTPVVVVFHDAIAEQRPDLIFPNLRSRLFWNLKTWLAMRQATRLVAVSQNARAQIATTFRRPLTAIDVVNEGPAPCFQPLDATGSSSAVLKRYNLPEKTPLILYVGGISPHKNLETLVRAARQVKGPWHLVLVGDYSGDSFFSSYSKVVELVRKLDIVDRVTFTGYVSDVDLAVLYNLATMLVLPSFNEGFGLPVIEAMACGLPVAASNRGSLPEVVNDAGLLFDPFSETEMTTTIERLLGDESLRRELRRKALERAKLFSWKDGAGKMISILEEAAGADRT